MIGNYYYPDYNVSIHAPARGATRFILLFSRGDICFNPRSRTGSDTLLFQSVILYFLFQSTLPHGERLLMPIIISPRLLCFNPRSRTGSDGISVKDAKARLVSIHAPARGATADHTRKFCGFRVSIHAPARGATTYN